MESYIKTQIDEIIDNLFSLKTQAGLIFQISKLCTEAIKNGHKIIFCGNGGSAAQSQQAQPSSIHRQQS